MKRILINATQKEELRVAMVNGQKLYDLDIEVPSREQKKSNIYKAVITRVEPSLEAVFVNYGADRHGFLPFKEISREYIDDSAKDDKGRYNIKEAIKVDQQIIVQVEKEERGNKGAALTTFISLAGRFLVAMPQNPKAGGVSRRIEGEDREQVRKVLSEINFPQGMGVIVRTAGVGRSTEEMQWDLDSLSQVWTAIINASKERSAPFLIYQESDIVVRALRDHYKSDIGEIIIDSKSFYDRAYSFMQMVMPNSLNKLKLFDEKLPLFNRFQIESQIETAFNREVSLPSGGAIVIDHTEALISVDVNSARATKGSDIEATATNTNLEAADEIARQLRIRDLGGLVVIDFIDMLQNKNQRSVEQRLKNAVYEDRARVQTTRISRFGLMEMSRQRLRPSLGESSQIVCPRCKGQGTIRDVESLALAVLRLLQEEALKDNTGRILVKIPVDCATYLLNEKRTIISELEDRHSVHALIIPDPTLETPHFEIERVRANESHSHESNHKTSYELKTDEKQPAYDPLAEKKEYKSEQAAVDRISHNQPKPPTQEKEKPTEEKQKGFIAKIISSLFGADETEKEEKKKEEEKNQKNKGRKPQNRGGRRNNQYRNNQNRNRNNQNRNRNNQDKDNNSSTQENKSQNNEGKNVKPDTNAVNKNQNDANGNQDNASDANDNNGNKQERKPRNNRSRNRNRNQRRKPENKPENNQNAVAQEGNASKVENTQENQKPQNNQHKPSTKNEADDTKLLENKSPNATKKPTPRRANPKADKTPEQAQDKGITETKQPAKESIAKTESTQPSAPAKKVDDKPAPKAKAKAKQENADKKSEQPVKKAEPANNEVKVTTVPPKKARKPRPRPKPAPAKKESTTTEAPKKQTEATAAKPPVKKETKPAEKPKTAEKSAAAPAPKAESKKPESSE